MSAELDALDGFPETIKLSSGTFVEIQDLKSRQFFKFLRIVTHGALPLVSDMSLFKFDADTDINEFGARLLSIMLLSIPDAEAETIEFLQTMVKPAGLIEGRKLNKQDTERNNALWEKLDAEMENPELEDLITLIEAIIKREAADMQALGKRLSAMFNLAVKTGQIDQAPSIPKFPEPSSSEDSPAPTTSSLPNTDGTTTSSATSPSAGYDSVPLQYENAGTYSSGSVSNG